MEGTRFVLDEKKACELSGMSIEEIYAEIDEKAKHYKLTKTGKCTYVSNDDEHAIARIGNLCLYFLIEQDWFRKSVLNWEQFDEEYSDDVIAMFKEEYEIGA